jgi:tetratricopeptide (TPR) repeat protein
MEFALINFKPDFLKQYGLPELPFPMRLDRTATALQKGVIKPAEMLEELLVWLAEMPAERDRYQPAVARLAYVAGVNAGNAKDPAAAASYFRISLDANSTDLTVMRNYGLALTQTGNVAEAITVYERIIGIFEKQGISPEVWGEAARLHASMGNNKRALELLEQGLQKAPHLFAHGPEIVAELRKRISEADAYSQGGQA